MAHAIRGTAAFRVMLSSTFRDLQAHRDAVLDLLPSYGLAPLAMEYDAALAGEDLISASLKKVEECDAYVGIISSYRYGQMPVCPARNPKKLSLTELEFRRAVELKKPICMFLMSGAHLVPGGDAVAERRAKGKLTAFRKLASDGRIYAEFDSVEDLRTKAALSFHKLLEVLDGAGAAAAPQAEPDLVRKAPEFYAVTDYIPGHVFVGRTREILLLDEWVKATEPVLLFEAIGGMGKSMLTWHWVQKQAPKARSDWAGRFWYSFYERGADMSDFCAYALAYTTGRPLKEFRGRKTTALTPELIEALHAEPWLLVLDGLERVLVAYNRYDAAQAADEDVEQDPDGAGRHPEACIRPADEDLLRLLSGVQPSKVLITSRLMPRALLNRAGQALPGVRHIELQGLDPADAERLMCDAGVRGDSARTQQYIQRHFGGHPLVVGVVAGLVARYRPAPGDFDRWADDPQGGADVDLASMEVVQRRNHILKAAFADLTAEERVLMVRLGLVSDAVDLETIEALNPYRPAPPEKVEEPTPPEERTSFEERIAEMLREADGGERDVIQQGMDELRTAEEEEYERGQAAYQEYKKRLEEWQNSPALKAAPGLLKQALDDLEMRGILNWDRARNQYDLHPVVRNYAVHCLPVTERRQIGQTVVDYFTSRSDPAYEAAETMADVRNGLQVVRSLLQIGELRLAYDILKGDITFALLFNLERYSELLALLRPYFPDGWANPPQGLESKMSVGDVATSAALALSSVGRSEEAIAAGPHAISSHVYIKSVGAIGRSLRNHCLHLMMRGHQADAERALLLEEELAATDDDKDHRAKAAQLRLRYSVEIGNISDAEAAVERFNSLPRPKDRGIYRPGDAEEDACQLAFIQNRLDGELLSSALREARSGKNRGAIRRLHLMRADWLLSTGQFREAEAAYEQTIAMARESGLLMVDAEASRAVAQARQGKIEQARETAERVSLLEDPPEITLAELFLALGDRDKALGYVRRGYQWAWADGAPYVKWKPLQQCRAIFEALGQPEPQLPPFDPSKATPLLFEAELRVFIEELKAEKEKEALGQTEDVQPSTSQ